MGSCALCTIKCYFITAPAVSILNLVEQPYKIVCLANHETQDVHFYQYIIQCTCCPP